MSAGGAEREARELAELIKAGHISSFDDSIEAVLQFAARCANEARLQEANAAYWCWKLSHEDFGANQQWRIDELRKES